MTAFDSAPSLTLRAARALYFEANGFGPDGGYNEAWVDFKLGPVPFPFPNTPGRLRAVRLHDLHHVLTGYDTDFLGELEISAWEIGGGCGDYWVAWQLNLGAMAAGALLIPRRTWRAFLSGRRSGNLYPTPFDDALLARTVGEVREALGLARESAAPAGPRDAAVFAASVAAGLAVGSVFFALTLPGALAMNVVALLRRPPAKAPRVAERPSATATT
jgi:hypothetical protein